MGRWAEFLSLFANWHWVDDGLARAAQIYGRFNLTLLHHHGIRTVINLRGENPDSPWYRDERAACEALGAAYVDLRFGSRKLPLRAALLDLLDAYDRMARPGLVKCSGGADRTALAAGLYLLHTRGPEAMGAARRHLRRVPYLHFPDRHQRWIRAFFDFYEADGAGTPVRTWIAERYSPEAFAAFMEARGQHGYWRPPRRKAAKPTASGDA